MKAALMVGLGYIAALRALSPMIGLFAALMAAWAAEDGRMVVAAINILAAAWMAFETYQMARLAFDDLVRAKQ